MLILVFAAAIDRQKTIDSAPNSMAQSRCGNEFHQVFIRVVDVIIGEYARAPISRFCIRMRSIGVPLGVSRHIFKNSNKFQVAFFFNAFDIVCT